MSRAISYADKITKYRLTESQKELVAQNYELAFWVVRKYLGTAVAAIGTDDVGSLALDALVHAAACWKPDWISPKTHKPVKFCTYATATIRRIVERNVRQEHRIIRIPEHVYSGEQGKCKRAKLVAAAELAKLVVRFGVFQERLEENGGSNTWEPRAKEERPGLDSDELAQLQKFLRRLPPRSRTVLDLRFHDGLTLQEAGWRLGVTKEAVRQIQEKAIDELRDAYGIALRSPKRIRRVKCRHGTADRHPPRP